MNTIAPITLCLYNQNWIDVFNSEKEKISCVFGQKNVLIEHIGSTAICGTIAKPEIDIMIGLKDLKDFKNFKRPLEGLNYVYFSKFEEFVPERRYFRKSDGIIPLFHIHIVKKKSKFWRDRIFFRNYMRNHPKDIQRYNKLKQDLVLKFNYDRKNYSNGKEYFILDILNNQTKKNIGRY